MVLLDVWLVAYLGSMLVLVAYCFSDLIVLFYLQHFYFKLLGAV